MKRMTGIICTCLCLILCGDSDSFAKEWRGLAPLRSTRLDAIQVLGQPVYNPVTNRLFYDTAEGQVSLLMIRQLDDPMPLGEPDSWYQLRNVVMAISLKLTRPIPMDEVEFDWHKFFVGTDEGQGDSFYSDENEGISYSVVNGRVVSVTYSPTKKELREWYKRRERRKSTP